MLIDSSRGNAGSDSLDYSVKYRLPKSCKSSNVVIESKFSRRVSIYFSTKFYLISSVNRQFTFVQNILSFHFIHPQGDLQSLIVGF